MINKALTRDIDPYRRGDYDSGDDFVLEYGNMRFTFNDRDFSERCEQAAKTLGFITERLQEAEVEDLVNLTVNGEVTDPASTLGEHVNHNWDHLDGPAAERSMIHWLRRLVFRSAWLDQRVLEQELDVKFSADSGGFIYVHPDRDNEPVRLAKAPCWQNIAYVG